MEISVPQSEIEYLDLERIFRFSREYGVELWSFHLPFAPFEKLDITSENLAKTTITYFQDIIKKISGIGVDKFVLHASVEPISDIERSERMATAKESLFKLAEFARGCGSVIAVENLPRTCLGKNSTEINELISVHPDLRVCYDTNHLLGESAIDFIRSVGSKIITTHVSDYDFINERHWLPGEGKLDFSCVLSSLKEVGYSGPWLYEIGFKQPKSIYRDRELTCADFARNAKELFSGEKPTVFSRPKPNLGFWE